MTQRAFQKFVAFYQIGVRHVRRAYYMRESDLYDADAACTALHMTGYPELQQPLHEPEYIYEL
jgi:hypothetical protein